MELQRNQTGRTSHRRPRQRIKANDLKIGTWNIQTLYKPRAMQNLIQVLTEYKADITALQEIRWTGTGILQKKMHTLYYSCDPNTYVLGTGFLVSKRIAHLVIDFEAISPRLCRLRVKSKFFNVSIINIHAPTEEKPDLEKDDFYAKLESVYDKCPKHDIKIVIGDANAKVGRESAYRPTIGVNSLHEISNDNGTRLISFASSMNMILASTRFEHKKIHKATWRAPDGITFNQIDHVLIDARHASNILDVRTRRGANADSDHFLVMAKMRARISSSRRGPVARQKKYNTEALNDEAKADEYKQKLTRILNEVNVRENDTDEMWNGMEKAIIRASEEILGEQPRPPRNDWFDSECQTATKKKNEAYKRMIQSRCTRTAVEAYKETRREEKRIHKTKKKLACKKDFEELENLRTTNECRKFYEKINRARKEYKPRSVLCRNKEGELLNDKTGILQRWAEYFNDLLNESEDTPEAATHQNPINLAYPARSVNSNNTASDTPTLTEVAEAINKLKNHKAPGIDSITAEMIKSGGDALLQYLHKIIGCVWETAEIPRKWNIGIICPIHKNGDILECKNYRGITLLNIAYKVLSNILCNRITPYADRAIGSYQCGFRRNKSTTNHYALRVILEKTIEFNIDTHCIFIDFKKAYDSVKRGELFDAMRRLGVPEHLVNLVKATLSIVECKVKVQGDCSESFTVNRGLRQGDALSCVLFNIALHQSILDSGIQRDGTIFSKSTMVLAYADDIVIISRSLLYAKEAFISFIKAAEKMGLKVNETKTKYMHFTREESRTRAGQNLTIDEYNIEVVKEFIYLGTLIDTENSVSREIKRRIMMANRTYYGLLKHLRSRILSRSIKCKIYKTLIRPVLTYGCESWTMSKKDEDMLGRFERKVLRRIYGPIREDGLWRIRYNHELYQLYEEANIIKYTKISRLRWIGHVIRMNDSEQAKKVTFSNPEGRRRAGRPRKRLLDSIEEDLRNANITRWRERANNREEWRRVLEAVKACRRL